MLIFTIIFIILFLAAQENITNLSMAVLSCMFSVAYWESSSSLSSPRPPPPSLSTTCRPVQKRICVLTDEWI